jgi:hypothetical protein
MRKIAFFFIICSLISCKKHDEQQDQIPPTPQQPDNILYHDIQPDSSIHSVTFYYPIIDPYSCGPVPSPHDSSAVFKLDINGDSINDFSIYTSHGVQEWNQISPHCKPVLYSIGISGINAGDSISFVHPYSIDIPVRYDTANNKTISYISAWKASATLQLIPQGLPYYPTASFSDTYIGIKVNYNIGWIHVAPSGFNGITIKEYAINLTLFNSINAGQKQ